MINFTGVLSGKSVCCLLQFHPDRSVFLAYEIMIAVWWSMTGGWESKRLHPDWIFLIHLSLSQFPFHHPSVGHGHMLLKASSARIKSLIQINKKNKYNWAMVLQAKLSRFSKASQLYYLTSYDVQLPSETHELFHVRHVTQCSDHGCHGNLDVPLGRWS